MKRVIHLLLPTVGVALAILAWWGASVLVPELPSPARTWEESKIYILEPLAKRGEMDQGIVLLAFYSLMRVARGFLLGIAIATPHRGGSADRGRGVRSSLRRRVPLHAAYPVHSFW